MTPSTLQALLRATGHYTGDIDGAFGPKSQTALKAVMADGLHTPLTTDDFRASAKRLNVEAAAVSAVTSVESGPSGFSSLGPLILCEPHLFSRATGGVYDASHPNISYPKQDSSKYPKTQADRYEQLAQMVSLNPDAGFASVSYGKFQILGSNYAACGFANSYTHAVVHAGDEVCQLFAFEGFVRANKLDVALRNKDWAAFARGYNGPNYAVNKYDQKLAAGYAAAKAKGL